MTGASRFRISLLIVASTFAACSGPVQFPEPLIESPEVLLSSLQGKATPETLYLYARAEFYSDQGVRKGKLLFMAGTPDRIHVEALSPTDDMLTLLASPGGEFVYYERGGKRCIKGATCPQNTARFLPVPLSIPQVIGLLAGKPPLIDHQGAVLKFRRKAGLYELRLEDPATETTQVISVDPFRLDVVSTTIRREADGLKVRLDFDDYKVQGRYRLPGQIRARLNQHDTDLSLEVREVEADLEFKGDPFTVLCPRGAGVEHLPCPGEVLHMDEGGDDG